MDDEKYMRIAIGESYKSIAEHNGQTGCVIVKNDQVFYSGHNKEITDNDPTAHAEIVCIRGLCSQIKSRNLEGYTLYSTLQPCGMCTLACVWAGISKIVYGAKRKDVDALFFDENFLNTEDLVADSKYSSIKIISGVLEKECSELYKLNK